jgi:hypothetical protein
MKEVKKTCWVVECEEFCAPLPAIGKDRCGCCGAPDCGGNCRGECGEHGQDGICSSLFSKPLVPPQCGKVRCRKTLLKKEITSQVPVYKCVVVPTCRCDGGRHCEVPRTDDAGDLAAFGFTIPPMPPAATRK